MSSRSPRHGIHGAHLLLDLFWLGVVYGTLDALLLSVMAVLHGPATTLQLPPHY